MKNCGICMTANDDNAKFCRKCGNTLPTIDTIDEKKDSSQKCTKCGTPVPPGCKFCIKCGNKVEAPERTDKIDTKDIGSGVNNGPVKKCPTCGKNLPVTSKYCFYCGGNTEPKKNKSKLPIIIIIIFLILLFLFGGLCALDYFTDIKIPFIDGIVTEVTNKIGNENNESVNSDADDDEDPVKDKTTEEEKTTEKESEKTTEAETEPVTEFRMPVLYYGDTIEFGSYPQSAVKNKDTINKLQSLAPSYDKWVSYRYKSGNGSQGSMRSGDWMKYVDVEYDGEKYRGVYFTDYRPKWIYDNASSGNSDQDDNGMYTDTYYWFKYEPLRWIVLHENEGYLMCENAIDAQCFSDTVYKAGNDFYNDGSHYDYANNYESSYIRTWLNDDFLYTAFNSDERAYIVRQSYYSGSWAEKYGYYESYGNDYVSILSYDDATNPGYGFKGNVKASDSFRLCSVTDYAKAQGIGVRSDGKAMYVGLRSAGDESDHYCGVEQEGNLCMDFQVESTRVGVRPVIHVAD